MTLISQSAYLATIVTFFAVAIILALSRIILRLYNFRRVYIDDYFLYLALSTLITANALFFAALPELYLFADAVVRPPLPAENFIQVATDTATFCITAHILSWTTIFAVKFSFLFYFRGLVRRLPRLRIWWWIVVAICVPVAIFSMFGSFIACPHVGRKILTHCVGTQSFLPRERDVIYYSVVSDIVTDVLIISIPVCLLRETQLGVCQKTSIGLILCLSMFMIAIAMVRGITGAVYGTHDQIWASFWVQLETSVSIIMVSTMMFRTLSVVKTKTPRQNPSPRSGAWLLWREKKRPELPEIQTGAIMTGMRTVIRANGRTTLSLFGRGNSPVMEEPAISTSGHGYSVSMDEREAKGFVV